MIASAKVLGSLTARFRSRVQPPRISPRLHPSRAHLHATSWARSGNFEICSRAPVVEAQGHAAGDPMQALMPDIEVDHAHPCVVLA